MLFSLLFDTHHISMITRELGLSVSSSICADGDGVLGDSSIEVNDACCTMGSMCRTSDDKMWCVSNTLIRKV
jgi:hypothetical protein